MVISNYFAFSDISSTYSMLVLPRDISLWYLLVVICCLSGLIATRFGDIAWICVVAKQSESEVGNDMLMVSEDVFHLDSVNVNVESRHLSKVRYWYHKDLMNLFVNINILRSTCVWFRNSIDVCLKYKMQSETSNMSLSTSDSFCLITAHMISILIKYRIIIFKTTTIHIFFMF